MSDFEPGTVAYIADEQVIAKVIEREKPAKQRRNRGKPWQQAALLWGDEVKIRSLHGSKVRVSAKGHLLEVKKDSLTKKSILSIWQIDCGQGDSAVIRFPDGRWAAIDVGPGRHGRIKSNTGRTAVDFMKWLAFTDRNWMFEGAAKSDTFHFDWLAFTHPDEDHIGAGPEFVKKLGDYWSVGTVYHCGLARFRGRDAAAWASTAQGRSRQRGFSQLGEIDGAREEELYVVSLIDGWSDIAKYSKTTTRRRWQLGGNYAKILKALHAHRGSAVKRLKRLSHRSSGTALGGANVDVKVLGPIEHASVAGTGKPGLRYFDRNTSSSLDEPSLTRNGHSLVFRLDYGDVRILMTGDLNFQSQALLHQEWDPAEFKCHVAKACHHGSQEVSSRFLKAMSPMATMFSSGDQETHTHPRALIVGLSGALSTPMRMKVRGKYKKRQFDDFSEHTLFTPLIYSTELSRSARLRNDMKTYVKSSTAAGTTFTKVKNVHFKGSRSKDEYIRDRDVWIVDHLTYGLINVRTDGEKVLMAVLEEGDPTEPRFHIETFRPADMVPMEIA